jgi:integrase
VTCAPSWLRRLTGNLIILARAWHTLLTALAESGAGDEVIMSIAGHVSRAMLSRYSHVRMEAKRRALDEIAARQNAADDKRQKKPEVQSQAALPSQSEVVQ